MNELTRQTIEYAADFLDKLRTEETKKFAEFTSVLAGLHLRQATRKREIKMDLYFSMKDGILENKKIDMQKHWDNFEFLLRIGDVIKYLQKEMCLRYGSRIFIPISEFRSIDVGYNQERHNREKEFYNIFIRDSNPRQSYFTV